MQGDSKGNIITIRQEFENIVRDENLFASIPEPNILYSFFVSQGVNLLYDKAGRGKSIFALSLLNDVSLKQSYLSVYIDLDNSITVIKDRNIWNDDGTGIMQLNKNFIYLHREVQIPVLKNKFQSIFKKYPNDFIPVLHILKDAYKDEYLQGKIIIVLDSLQKVIDINDANQFNFLYKEMMKFDKFSYLILHHKNKSDELKGLSLIRDSVDSVYTIEDREKSGKEIVSITLKSDKERFRVSSRITFKIKDFMFTEIIDNDDLDKEVEIVLRTAISLLKKESMNYTKLADEIYEKLKKNIGIVKVRNILKEYASKKLFIITKSVNNSKIYSINYDSDIFKRLIDISDTKKSALELISSLDNVDIEVKLNDGSIIKFTNKHALISAVYKYDDEVVKTIIDKISNTNEDEDDIVDF